MLEWLVETYTARIFENVRETWRRVPQTAAFGDPIRLYYAIIGLAASTFTLAPEFKLLSGRDPFRRKEIDMTADLVEKLIFGTADKKK